MKHLLKLNNRYYYNRRVPETMRDFDPRKIIRVSLKTDSLETAMKRDSMMDQQIETYWSELISSGKSHSHIRYKQAVIIARQFGFPYKSVDQLANESIDKIVERTLVIQSELKNEKTIESLLGSIDKPSLKLSDSLELFWAISKDHIINKSEDQIRKWRNPRIKAIKTCIRVIGDKALTDLHRNDMIRVRDWYITRIENEGLKAATVNKVFIHLKTTIEAIRDHYQLDVDIDWLFKKIKLKESSNSHRPPFSTQFIQDHILRPHCLEQLNPEARAILILLSETGARPNEICSLNPEDIHTEHEIPHITISPRKGHELKTVYSKRSIPVIGKALHQISQFPKGFNRYNGKAESLSATLNKYLKTNGLLPTPAHCLYSLRHAFQDRLTTVNAPDRVQAELMGHKFNRPKYGDGPSLEQKQSWLLKISVTK